MNTVYGSLSIMADNIFGREQVDVVPFTVAEIILSADDGAQIRASKADFSVFFS